MLRFYLTKDCFFQSTWIGPDCPRWINFVSIVVLNQPRWPQVDSFWSTEKQQLITFSVPGPRRTEAIAPDLARKYKVVFDSDRRFPTIFAKMWPIDKKKDQVLLGPKQSLVKWPLYASHVWFISNIKPCPMGLYYFY